MVMGMVLQGWALVTQGKVKEGLALMRAGLERQHTLGIGIGESPYQMLLADAYAKAGQVEMGMQALAEALAAVEKTEDRTYEAELYRLKGQLTLQQCGVQSSELLTSNPESLTPTPKLKRIFRRPSRSPNGSRPNP
jgi:predicted ATPase